MQFVATRFQEEFGCDPYDDKESISDLMVSAEVAKKRLTSATTTNITLTHGANRGRYELSRTVFNEMTDDLMERTRSVCMKVLEEHGQNLELDGVLLVGGSTRMVMVQEFVERVFKKKPLAGVNVDEAVSLGAALAAAGNESRGSSGSGSGLRRRVTMDVTNHSLGMIAVNEDRSEYLNSIILPKNRTVPCVETRPYLAPTGRRENGQVDIYMTQGESDVPLDVSYLGKYVVKDVPQDPSGVTVVDVEYSYSASGTVSVSATARSEGRKLEVEVEPLPSDVPDRFGLPPIDEDGVEPATVYLCIDVSGSMAGEALDKAKRAARGFLSNIDLTNCGMGIIAVSDKVEVKVEACNNGKKIEHAIDALECGETGYGNETDPFNEIYRLLDQVNGRRMAMVLADGIWDDQDVAIERAKQCYENDIDIIAIGFGGADKKFLNAIASSDESSFFVNLNQLVERFSTIAQEFTESNSGGGVGKSLRAKLGK